MKPIVVFPLPMESKQIWSEFSGSVEKFLSSFRQFPGDCRVVFTASVGTTILPEEDVSMPAMWLDEIPYEFFLYHHRGCDIGGAQALSKTLPDDTLMIMLTTRSYFHRAGWLDRYVAAHELFPDALLGASASWEGGKRHICTRGYAMRAGLFASYPHTINSREDGSRFEIGDWCVTDWFYGNNRPCLQVTFDGVQPEIGWRHPENIYRKGDQSNMLIHDRHTHLYEIAPIRERHRLEALVNPS